MLKKLLPFVVVCALIVTTGCAGRKEAPYNRNAEETYEQFLSKYIFAACENADKPYALYSLATLNKKPSNNDPRYKVTFINGPCKGKTVLTTHIILKTDPVGAGTLPTGTVLLRNYRNPAPNDKEKTDRWHLGVVSGNSRASKGIVELSFPRDRNDFNPARESIYLHNVRYISVPEIKDTRVFIH